MDQSFPDIIIFDHVSKTFQDSVCAVHDVSFSVKKGETLVLLGKSGCGKTTTMKMMNRLIEPTSGKIFVQGSDIMQLDPILLRRKIGYAIQQIGLFDYMTIAENISIVPKLLKWDEQKIKSRIDELLELVGFDPKQYRSRYPKQLSGGEKQRIGVARAIAADPDIILMDEPFGALDPLTREQLQNEFIDLTSSIHKTVIFVTHDVTEAIKLADRIIFMDEGKIEQIATPSKFVSSPLNQDIAKFLGKHTFQLSLMTTSIENLNIRNSPQKENKRNPHLKLSKKSSLFDALNFFYKTNDEELLVIEDNKKIGYLKRVDLFSAVLKSLKKKQEK